MSPEDRLSALRPNAGPPTGDCLSDEQLASAAASPNTIAAEARRHIETCDVCFDALSAALDSVDLLADATASLYATSDSVTVRWAEGEETISFERPRAREALPAPVAAERSAPYGKPRRITMKLGSARLECTFASGEGEARLRVACRRRAAIVVLTETGGPLLARLVLQPGDLAEVSLPLETPSSLSAAVD